MCFSAGASFGASVVLGTIGIVTVSKVKIPSQLPFATIPLMFAFQQLSEGILWVALSDVNHSQWSHWPALIFLVFAQLIWPIWIPFSIFRLERNNLRKKGLGVFLLMGVVIALYLLYCLLVHGFSAEMAGGHIQYNLDFPEALAIFAAVFYFIPIAISPFVSSVKGMIFLGLANLLSFSVAQFYHQDHLISVWCFFAAVLSVLVLDMIVRMNAKKTAGVLGI